MEETTQITNPQPVTPPPTPSSSRNLVPIVVVAIVVAILASLGTYMFMSSQQNKQSQMTNQQPTTTQISPTQQTTETITVAPETTSNWKTYTSEDTTFSFQYPSDWTYETKKTTLELQGKKYNATSILAGRPLTEGQRKMQGYIDINDAPKTYNDFSLVYATHADFTNLSADNLIEELIKTRASQVDSPKTLLLNNNIQAKEVGYGCQASCIDVLFRYNNTIFDASTGPNAEANIATVRQILSTIKFTNN